MDNEETIKNQENAREIKTAKLKTALAEVLLERNLPDVVRPMNLWRIGMTIIEFDIQLVINVSGPIMLGRANSADGEYNYIDLSPYKAHHYGVSRKHALIALKEDKIAIQDNNSSNGILLNGKRLKPMETYSLRNGDRVRLAELRLRFTILYNPFSGGKQNLQKQ